MKIFSYAKHIKIWLILPPSGRAVICFFFSWGCVMWKKKILHSVSKVFTRYGKCYTFNAGEDGRPPLITTKGGMGNGLELMLDIQQDEYLPIWGETGEGRITHLQIRFVKVWSVCYFLRLSPQTRRHLKLGSKFRSTVKMSPPSSTNLGLEWHPDFRHLSPVRSKGYEYVGS